MVASRGIDALLRFTRVPMNLLFPGWSLTTGVGEKGLLRAHAGECGLVVGMRYPLSYSRISAPAPEWAVVRLDVVTRIRHATLRGSGPWWVPGLTGSGRVTVIDVRSGVPLLDEVVPLSSAEPTWVVIRPATEGVLTHRRTAGSFEARLDA